MLTQSKKANDEVVALKIPEIVQDAVQKTETLQGSPLQVAIQSLSADGTVEIAKSEVEGIRNDLLNLIQNVTDQALGDQITNLLMDIDDKLFGGGDSDAEPPEGGEGVADALNDALGGGLDDFFKESRKTAAGFPNLFSNDTKKWIQLQTTNLAAKKGTPATPEQAQAYIDAAVSQVAQELATAIEPEVKKVVEESREKIFQDITSGVDLQAPQVKPVAPAVTKPTIPLPTEEPVTARKRAVLSAALQKAFDNSYAYDAIAYVLQEQLGSDFVHKYAADELIDEENSILDLAKETFPKIEKDELSDAFGNVLTDVYSHSR